MARAARRAGSLLIAMSCLLGTACGAHRSSSTNPAGPGLADTHRCSGRPGFSCSTLSVPLDPTGNTPGTLRLQVAAADNVTAPRGVLLFLTGGPGQPGAPSISRIATQRLPSLARQYRFVMIDQRGTGQAGAIVCPALQAQVGSSDIAVPQPDAVGACATTLGPSSAFYGTDETVADLEALRKALGVPSMTLDGVSYGSFTAERYAIAHPGHVTRLVLDSVVPHHATADESLYLVGLRAQSSVLRHACAVARPVASTRPRISRGSCATAASLTG